MGPRVEPVQMPADGEWHVVNMDRNPVPGNIGGLYRAVDWSRAEAGARGQATTQHNEAKSPPTNKGKENTADAFRNKIGDIPDKLGILKARFENIATALEGFAQP